MKTAPPDERGLSFNVLQFARLLRREGVGVSTTQLLAALKGLTCISLDSRDDFYWALRCTMSGKSHEIEIFDRCFSVFWDRAEEVAEEVVQAGIRTGPSGESEEPFLEVNDVGTLLEDAPHDAEEDPREDRHTMEYSPAETLGKKDFDLYTDPEANRVQRAIEELARKLSTRLSRRRQPGVKGDLVDLRRSFRRIVEQGGEPLPLVMSERKRKKIKIVLLCDVSGSMDAYSRFFTRFMYAMQNRRVSVETFVFSTRLTRITSMLLSRSIDDAFSRMGKEVKDWSGGTDIGGCLRTFNTRYASAMVNSRTVIIIVSDGWDRGDADLLGGEMARLHRRAYRTIWLNPLCGLPDYEPLCKGMQAALPHIHHLMPAHNLASLEELARRLPLICP